jgi:N-acyl-D-aspartate/D-glutamate deacylase
VIDQATYAEPALPAVGFRHVVVAGTPVIRDGEVVEGVRPGRGVKGGR